MRTRTTSSVLVALLATLLALGASNAQATTVKGSPVGIAIGQTARVSALNAAEKYIEAGVKFLDEDGSLLAEFRERIEPGKTMSFDLDRDTLIREGNRIEIHAVIDIHRRYLRHVAIRLEVFNNDDGRTTSSANLADWQVNYGQSAASTGQCSTSLSASAEERKSGGFRGR